MPGDDGALPTDVSWRYRRDGLPRAFALFGVLVGLVLFAVPGVFALLSYTRWQRQEQAEPTLPWSLSVIALVAIPAVPLFMTLPIAGIAFALLVGLPLLVLVGPRH